MVRVSQAGTVVEGDRVLIERAAGLLAGRSRCRVADAHRHLVRMAADQQRDMAEVAAGVLRVLDAPAAEPWPPAQVPQMVAAALGLRRPVSTPIRRYTPWVSVVQRVLDSSPGMSG